NVRYDVGSRRLAGDTTLEARSGDEPHYVLMMNSMLFDHDLELGTDYRRACAGGRQLGARNAGAALEHHTIVVDRTTADQAIWGIVYDPNWVTACKPTARRTERFSPYHDLVEVPAHPVAFSAMLAAAIAPLSPTLETSERDAAYVIVVVAWLTVLLTYALGLHL